MCTDYRCFSNSEVLQVLRVTSGQKGVLSEGSEYNGPASITLFLLVKSVLIEKILLLK